MTALNRRQFLIMSAAALSARGLPVALNAARQRRILTLVYDKSLGMMRAIDRVVP